MKKNEPVSNIMSKDVLSAHTGQKVSDVRKLMAKHSIHHVPVVSGEKLVGIISASDILGISAEGIDADRRSIDAYLDHQFSIETLMTPDPQSLASNAPIREAADVLAGGTFHAIPIADEGNLVGIVTTTDLIKYLRDLY